MILHLDFESASDLNLTKVGASRYTRHPSTVVTVIAWAFDSLPVQSVTMPNDLPDAVRQHLERGEAFAAWNASFETSILENIFHIPIRHDQAVCSMQRALYAGLPAKLEKAGPALGLALVKDMAGHRLMLQMSKPRKDGTFWHQDPVEGPIRLKALEAYCRQDVEAERAIDKVIPHLSPEETLVSALDFDTNRRGIRLDLPLVGRLLNIAGKETQLLNAECTILTAGAVTSPGTQTERLTKWLRNEGIGISDLSKESVSEALEPLYASTLLPHVRRVLEIRQQVAKSSVKKLQAMLNTVDDDDRVRGTLQYYGAGRTGRFSGRMIQPQNFPRPEDYANDAIDAIRDHDFDHEGVRAFYGDPLTVVASCLRGCLIPAMGRTFFCYDLEQIEARVLAWLAGQNDVLDAFRRGDDVYQFTADRLNLGERTAGKVAVLGLGYGMGHVAFVDFAKNYGLDLTKQQSADIVFNWREANPWIRKLWWGMDSAVKSAIRHPHRAFSPDQRPDIQVKVRQSHGRDVLLIRLPSGRVLYYRNPRIEIDPVKPNHEAIIFDGVSQYTKLWEPIRTWGSKLVENITQAVARDVIVEAAIRVSRMAPQLDLVLSVHDELLFEAPEFESIVMPDVARNIIELPSAWMHGLPVRAKGGTIERYGKP